MSIGRQGGAEELSATQKGFEFADKLNYFFSINSKNGNQTYTINETLLMYLGEKKYHEFCKNFRYAHKEYASKYPKAFFKEEFSTNPVNTDDIVTDYEIASCWNSLAAITSEVIKLL